jgi:hypothetical protein
MSKPFPVPAFFQPSRYFPQMAAMGVNTICGPTIEGNSTETPAQWCAAAKAAGLAVVLKSPTAPLPSNCVGVMLSVDEPNEPKGNKPIITPAQLKAESDQLRAAFPGMPIWLSLGGDKVVYDGFPSAADKDLYLGYASVADVLTVDFYSANKSNKYPMTHTAKAVANLKALTGKALIPWCECNDQQLDPPKLPETNGAPTPDQIKATVDACLAAKADGIGWFFTCQKGSYRWPDSWLPQIDRAGRSMQPQYDMVKSINFTLNPPPPTTEQRLAAAEQRVAKLESQWAIIAEAFKGLGGE